MFHVRAFKGEERGGYPRFELHISGVSINIADDCFVILMDQEDLDELETAVARAMMVIHE